MTKSKKNKSRESYQARTYTNKEIDKFFKLDKKESKELKIVSPGELIKILVNKAWPFSS